MFWLVTFFFSVFLRNLMMQQLQSQQTKANTKAQQNQTPKGRTADDADDMIVYRSTLYCPIGCIILDGNKPKQ